MRFVVYCVDRPIRRDLLGAACNAVLFFKTKTIKTLRGLLLCVVRNEKKNNFAGVEPMS